jgi:uncharacterized Zn finger protein (UPF0148 family)
MTEDNGLAEYPVCATCGTMHISEGAIICPKCQTHDPKIVYKHTKVTDLPTTDRNANTDVANAQQIAQEANKAVINELKDWRARTLLTANDPLNIRVEMEARIKALTSEKGSSNG